MIEIKGLSAAYHGRTILNEIHLSISEKERCALVGNNGAGKSTLIQTMLGLLPMRKGIVTFKGISNRKEGWKQLVSYLPEKFQMYLHLTGEENLRFFASLAEGRPDMAKLVQILRKVQLWEARDRRIGGYSKGMLQRLGLGLMLYFDTEILVLDEPTSGLDPEGRAAILEILRTLTGKTISFSSHHLEEIRSVCTHVAQLKDGKVSKFTVEQFFQENNLGVR